MAPSKFQTPTSAWQSCSMLSGRTGQEIGEKKSVTILRKTLTLYCVPVLIDNQDGLIEFIETPAKFLD